MTVPTLPKPEFRIWKNPDTNKFDVVEVVQTDIPTEGEADAAIAEWNLHIEQPVFELDEEETNAPEPAETDAEVSGDNPYGLAPHARIANLIASLSKAGIKVAEAASPRQNPDTTLDKFAKVPADGQNKVAAEEQTPAS